MGGGTVPSVNRKREEKLGIANGAGPICVYCWNARKDLLAHPETFDIADHVEKCRKRARAYLKKRGIPCTR